MLDGFLKPQLRKDIVIQVVSIIIIIWHFPNLIVKYKSIYLNLLFCRHFKKKPVQVFTVTWCMFIVIFRLINEVFEIVVITIATYPIIITRATYQPHLLSHLVALNKGKKVTSDIFNSLPIILHITFFKYLLLWYMLLLYYDQIYVYYH